MYRLFSGSIFFLLFLPSMANTQQIRDSSSTAGLSTSIPKGLFDTEGVLDLTLSGNVRALLNDRSEVSKYHPLTISYRGADSIEISIAIEAKTRGHFRKSRDNCLYPPLLLHFSKSKTLESSIFSDNHKMKLVMPCQGDQYVIHEWLVYKLYNLVTAKSFKARLVKIKIEDVKTKKPSSPFYGMLLEEEKEMAKRNGATAVNLTLRPEQTDVSSFLNMAVFEYLIGNTDWSIQFLQNIKLLAFGQKPGPIPVPYDFDMSGLVNTPYAKPAEELNMKSVLERRYRGYCIQDMKQFDGAISLFNQLKKNIYEIFTNCPLLDDKYKKATVKFFDEFYSTINNPDLLSKEFGYPCDKNGTGNVVIKGLRDD